jgi:hypothetical protein
VDRVFLTGGTSLIPRIRRLFEERFGDRADRERQRAHLDRPRPRPDRRGRGPRRMGGVAARARGRRLKVFFDGGCRPNPGRIEVAVVARGVTYFFDDLGTGTSSDAEWLALAGGAAGGAIAGRGDFELIGDCANVIARRTARRSAARRWVPAPTGFRTL